MAQAQTEVLSNQSITDMIEIGLSEGIIVAKIKTSDTDFNTNVEALKVLKEKGVSDNIIMAMINRCESRKDESVNIEPNKVGIYINESGELIKIRASAFSANKTSTLGSALTYGLVSSTMSATLNNSISANVVNNNSPEFIFFFNQYNPNEINWQFSSETSPNEFILIRLDRRSKTREMKTGSVNIYSGISIGIDENSIIPTDIIAINEYSFKVTPTDPLTPGEYCFLYKGTGPQGVNNQSVYDFSISQGREIIAKHSIGSTIWTLVKGKPKRCDVNDVKLKKDGVYYELFPHITGGKIERKETECYNSKQELIKALKD